MKNLTILVMLCITIHFNGYSQDTYVYVDERAIVEKVENYIYGDELTRKESKKAFKEIKALSESEEGYAEAIWLLGVLYKDGIGTHLNFNKARKQFKKSHELGSEKGAYSLGYLYLKGLGSIDQDYKKAIRWFKKSKAPMAKHWLAKCYYHGFGVPMDKEKAIDMLLYNPIANSHVLLPKWEYEMSLPSEDLNNNEVPENETESGSTLNEESTSQTATEELSDGIAGRWSGDWKILDWAEEQVMLNVPISIEISDDGRGMMKGKIELNGGEYSGSIVQVGSELIFHDITVPVKQRYADHPSEMELDYRLLSFNFRLENNDKGQFIKGDLESNITNWSEPASPGQLILRREGTALSQEVIDAFSEQKEHFIKVYPNPFEEDLLLHYILEHDSDVSIQLLDYYQPSKVLKNKVKRQRKGERTVTLDGLNSLTRGLYIVDMNVGAERYTRIVIKK